MKENVYFLEALLEGNSKIIQLIYQNNFLKVRQFVMQNKGQQQDAEDVFQLALLQLTVRYKKEKFEIKSSFEGYLFTVCKNLWRRELNKSKNRVTNQEIVELVSEDEDMVLSIIEQKRWELFQNALKQISENCQEILKMFFAKVSYSVMVERMQYSSETVARQRVFKCKAQLTKMIKNNKSYKSLS